MLCCPGSAAEGPAPSVQENAEKMMEAYLNKSIENADAVLEAVKIRATIRDMVDAFQRRSDSMPVAQTMQTEEFTKMLREKLQTKTAAASKQMLESDITALYTAYQKDNDIPLENIKQMLVDSLTLSQKGDTLDKIVAMHISVIVESIIGSVTQVLEAQFKEQKQVSSGLSPRSRKTQMEMDNSNGDSDLGPEAPLLPIDEKAKVENPSASCCSASSAEKPQIVLEDDEEKKMKKVIESKLNRHEIKAELDRQKETMKKTALASLTTASENADILAQGMRERLIKNKDGKGKIDKETFVDNFSLAMAQTVDIENLINRRFTSPADIANEEAEKKAVIEKKADEEKEKKKAAAAKGWCCSSGPVDPNQLTVEEIDPKDAKIDADGDNDGKRENERGKEDAVNKKEDGKTDKEGEKEQNGEQDGGAASSGQAAALEQPPADAVTK